MQDFLGWAGMACILVSAIGIGFGVDLKKWHGWAFVLSGLLLGVFMGFNFHNMILGLVAGLFFGGAVLFFGPMMLRRRRKVFGDTDESRKT
jgi:hypothetical protein